MLDGEPFPTPTSSGMIFCLSPELGAGEWRLPYHTQHTHQPLRVPNFLPPLFLRLCFQEQFCVGRQVIQLATLLCPITAAVIFPLTFGKVRSWRQQ